MQGACLRENARRGAGCISVWNQCSYRTGEPLRAIHTGLTRNAAQRGPIFPNLTLLLHAFGGKTVDNLRDGGRPSRDSIR